MSTKSLISLFLLASVWAAGPLDPTWMKQHVPDVRAEQGYRKLFEGERVMRSVVRYGEALGPIAEASWAAEERIYVVMEGAGEVTYEGRKKPLRAGDFFYCAPGSRHGIQGQKLRTVVMGFKAAAGEIPAELPLANLDEVKKQTVAGHPPTVLYQLMIGDTRSKRDRLAVAQTVTSLYVMEFEPGGTNAPHHHEEEEEIYYLIDGRGDMVAGSGADGMMGKYAARAGDAYFFRMNCTVGFYNATAPGAKARILAVRSRLPRR